MGVVTLQIRAVKNFLAHVDRDAIHCEKTSHTSGSYE